MGDLCLGELAPERVLEEDREHSSVVGLERPDEVARVDGHAAAGGSGGNGDLPDAALRGPLRKEGDVAGLVVVLVLVLVSVVIVLVLALVIRRRRLSVYARRGVLGNRRRHDLVAEVRPAANLCLDLRGRRL